MHFTLPQVSEMLEDILQKEDGLCTVYKYFLLSTLSYPQLSRSVVHCIQIFLTSLPSEENACSIIG